MPASEAVHVQGLRELQRAFARADKTLSRELRSSLNAAAAPVALDAQRLAVDKISHIGNKWQFMRVGVTRTLVYVAPKQRGRLSRRNPRLHRPNLAGLLLEKAMEPALERNRGRVEERVQEVLDTVGKDWER